MPSPRILPPGLDEQALDEFFNQVSTVLGEENLSRDAKLGALEGPSGTREYGDPFAAFSKNQPSGAIRPRLVSEIEAILKLANQFKVPIWTVSRGKNLGYGGAAPVVSGSVILDLQRMNKVIEINEEYAFAIVEPGVSFFDLYEEIQRRGLNLWPSVPALGWGSPVGNTLDRGFGYTPNGEHSQNQCGLEVVLPDGDVLRTGMGAMKDSSLFALHKGGYGPSVDGLFFQSNLGVVTKMGIHITPAPEAYATVEVSVPKEEDLAPLVGTLSDLMRRSVILNAPSIANIFRIAITSGVPEVYQKLAPYMGKGKSIPYGVLEEIRAEQNWGFWKGVFALYAPREALPGLLKATQRAFSGIPGVQFKSREFTASAGQFLTTSETGEEDIPQSGIPTLAHLQLLDSREPGSGHICFSPIIPPSGRELYDWYLSAKKRTIDAGFDFFADFHVYPRYIIGIELVIFTAAEQEPIDQLYKQLLADAAKQGYSEYRTHINYMDEVAAHFDFNKSALRRFMTLLKDVVDPNGILAQGKSGIWNSSKQLAPKI